MGGTSMLRPARASLWMMILLMVVGAESISLAANHHRHPRTNRASPKHHHDLEKEEEPSSSTEDHKRRKVLSFNGADLVSQMVEDLESAKKGFRDLKKYERYQENLKHVRKDFDAIPEAKSTNAREELVKAVSLRLGMVKDMEKDIQEARGKGTSQHTHHERVDTASTTSSVEAFSAFAKEAEDVVANYQAEKEKKSEATSRHPAIESARKMTKSPVGSRGVLSGVSQPLHTRHQLEQAVLGKAKPLENPARREHHRLSKTDKPSKSAKHEDADLEREGSAPLRKSFAERRHETTAKDPLAEARRIVEHAEDVIASVQLSNEEDQEAHENLAHMKTDLNMMQLTTNQEALTDLLQALMMRNERLVRFEKKSISGGDSALTEIVGRVREGMRKLERSRVASTEDGQDMITGLEEALNKFDKESDGKIRGAIVRRLLKSLNKLHTLNKKVESAALVGNQNEQEEPEAKEEDNNKHGASSEESDSQGDGEEEK